jgi:hypothetical protein
MPWLVARSFVVTVIPCESVFGKRRFIWRTVSLTSCCHRTGVGLRLTQEAVCWVLRYCVGFFLEGAEEGTNDTQSG